MSIHANQNAGTPSSDDKKIRGHNATYLSKVQKALRSPSATKPAGSNKRIKDSSVDGAHRTSSPTTVLPKPAGFGDGHYVPNKS